MRSTFAHAAASALLILGTAAMAEPPPATSGPVDGLISSPANFKLLLENDQVRVTRADGSHADYDEKTGDTYWGEYSPLHVTANIGTTPYVVLLVEVKGAK